MRAVDIRESDVPMGSGYKVFIICGKDGIRWSFDSDASGVTAHAAGPCLSSPDSDFFLVTQFEVIREWETGIGGQ